MLWTALRLLLVAYLPGALLFRLPVAHRETRAALPADERAFWAIIDQRRLVVGHRARPRGRRSLQPRAPVGLRRRPVGRTAGRSAGGGLRFAGTSSRPRWAAVVPLILVAVGLRPVLPAVGIRHRRQGPRRLHQRGNRDRRTRLSRDPRTGRRRDARRPLAICSSPCIRARRTTACASWASSSATPAPALVIGQFPHLYPIVGRDRLRARRAHRRAARDRLVVDPRPAGRVLRRGPAGRPAGSRRRLAAARGEPASGLVRALPELGDAEQSLVFAALARLRPRPRGR